ncbi:DUF4269 domain-containing protein [bacterium SCSIO 12741]|nr:DUF4269 domain-containing protein [bacterium SCSIO 12741]
MLDFTHLDYLKTGNERQRRAYRCLSDLNILENLKDYDPLLTGTIPIEIDLPESDLDIICYCHNSNEFEAKLNTLYSEYPNYRIHTSTWNNLPSTVAKFSTPDFDIEIFGQDCPTEKQNAYRHMLKEYEILKARGELFKAEVIRLKREGMKTEPAFAHLLGLDGNPYEELLKVEV